MQAIILAGGFGTRLRSVIKDAPKPMADISGKPFLAGTIERLGNQGITSVIISVHHLANHIKQYFGNEYKCIKILYAHEDKPLGTGGALKNSLALLQPKHPVIAMNGDTFTNVSYASMYKKHLENNANVTIAIKKMQNCERYGQVFLENDIIKTFNPTGKDEGFINAGSYIISPDLFDEMPEVFSFENDFMKPYVDKIKPLGYITDGYFIDIGIPEDYKKAREELGNIEECFA